MKDRAEEPAKKRWGERVRESKSRLGGRIVGRQTPSEKQWGQASLSRHPDNRSSWQVHKGKYTLCIVVTPPEKVKKQ